MNTPSRFTSHSRGFAFLSALFLMLVSAAPSAFAKEGAVGTYIAAQPVDQDPGCD